MTTGGAGQQSLAITEYRAVFFIWKWSTPTDEIESPAGFRRQIGYGNPCLARPEVRRLRQGEGHRTGKQDNKQHEVRQGPRDEGET
jgi:hypothetical protein